MKYLTRQGATAYLREHGLTCGSFLLAQLAINTAALLPWQPGGSQIGGAGHGAPPPSAQTSCNLGLQTVASRSSSRPA